MSERRYINYGHIIPMIGATLIFTLLFIFVLNPIFHNPTWEIVGTYLWILIFMFLFFNRILPFYVKVKKGELLFIGFPWIYRIRREWLDEFIIHSAADLFLKPKVEYAKKLRRIPKVKEGEYKGYYGIIFINYRAIGAIIEAMQPITGVDINWDKISPKWREYLQKKICSE